MSSKKDYERAAAIVKRFKQTDFTGAMEDAFVEFFRGESSRFDESRFREACNKK